MKIRAFVFLCAVCMIAAPALNAKANVESRAINQPVHPFHVVGSLYYAGASDVMGQRISDRVAPRAGE